MSTTRVSHLSDQRQITTSLNIARRKTDPLDLSADQTVLTVDRSTDFAGTIRATTGVVPLTGQGVELSHNGLTGAGGIGTITCYDRTGVVYQELDINALTIKFQVAGVTIGTVDAASMNLASGKVYKINAVQVVGPRDTGWVADTGTALKTANATYAAGATLTYSAAYVQAEQTATGTRLAAVELALQKATQELKALKDALLTHGLLGT